MSGLTPRPRPRGDLRVTINGNYFSADMLLQRQGVSGTDLTTGAKYQATGVSHVQFSDNFVNGQRQFSTADSFQLIGQGSAPTWSSTEPFSAGSLA